jgi:hypothetical protein
MAKRKAETQFIDQASHDAETVRLVREWASAEYLKAVIFEQQNDRRECAEAVLTILTREPAAKKARTRAGGK